MSKLIDSFDERYNPNNGDCATGKYGQEIHITWAEYELAIECSRLKGQIDDLKTRCDMLEHQMEKTRKEMRELKGIKDNG